MENVAPSYPPLLLQIVRDQLPRFAISLNSDSSKNSDYYLYLYLKLTSARRLATAFEEALIQPFFINPLKVAEAIDVSNLVSIERNLNRIEVFNFEIEVPSETYAEAYTIPPLCSEFHAF